MILIRVCAVITLAGFLSACAYIHSLDDNLPRQIDNWIKSKDYGKALDTLYYIQSDNSNYTQLMIQRAKIITLANQFEKYTLEQGNKHLKQQNWHQAHEVYEYGLTKLPDSRAIQKAKTQFLNMRKAYLKQLKLKLLQNKSKWLDSDTNIRKEITRVIPKNYSARWLLQDHKQDIDSTSKTLIECVTESIAQNELDVARQCLDIAQQLKPSDYFQKKIINVATLLEQEIQIRSRNLSVKGHKTLRSAKMALAKGDYRTAHKVINTLPAQDKRNNKILHFKGELDEQTADYVDNTTLEGRKLYSTGHVQEAYLLWKSLSSLSPNNERLQRLIKRAEKVLRKLHKIGSNQDIVIPPVNR